MKKIVSLVLVASFVVASAFSSLAASANVISDTGLRRQVEPSRLTLRDLDRLVGSNGILATKKDQLSNEHKKSARLINAKRLSATSMAIRLQFGDDDNATAEDYMVTTKSYTADNTNPSDPKYYIGSDPVYSREDMIAKYGPACFFFGLFEDTGAHKICGFAVAQRIKRWPNWYDLSFGSGNYDQESDKDFYQKHLNGNF